MRLRAAKSKITENVKRQKRKPYQGRNSLIHAFALISIIIKSLFLGEDRITVNEGDVDDFMVRCESEEKVTDH